MTADEVDTVLAVLTAHWTSKRLTEEEVETWERHLAGFDFDVAADTAELLIDHQPHFPRISEFREAARTVGRRKAMAPVIALETPLSERERYRQIGLANIKELRESLRSSHGGKG